MAHDGRALRILVLLDEYTRECLALRVARRLGSLQVIETLADVMLVRGIPEHIRSDNGPEFIAEELRKWLGKVGTKTLYIESHVIVSKRLRRLVIFALAFRKAGKLIPSVPLQRTLP